MRAYASRICCLDLDTFFVSVERVLDPSLEGRPVIVGGHPGERGVVTAASYEVRALGVRSGLSLTEAGRLAPHAVFLPGRHSTYGDYAQQVRDVVARFCPVIRVASIDEMFLDFRGCERLLARPGDADADATIERTIWSIVHTLDAELGLPASVGIATSRAVSKIASNLAKPHGVLLVGHGQEPAFLAPLPVRSYPGIGPVAEARLAGLGIQTLGQLALADRRVLRGALGAWADPIRAGARGEAPADLGEDRPAFREHDPEGGVVGSISNERTFREDVSDPDTIASLLCALCERVCWRARRRGVQARTITLKLRYADFQTLTRGRTVAPTNSEQEVYPVVQDLFRRGRARRLRLRLLGVALSNLGFHAAQGRLFGDDTRLRGAVDSIRDRYGFDSVRLGTASGRAFRPDDPRTRA